MLFERGTTFKRQVIFSLLYFKTPCLGVEGVGVEVFTSILIIDKASFIHSFLKPRKYDKRGLKLITAQVIKRSNETILYHYTI